jgi:hypothetical protein
MSPARTRRKVKRTFSLSPEALAYLEAIQMDQHLPSVSAALDQVIREKKLEAENKRISASVTNYYDSIGEEEMAEDRAWGQFAETQFPEG